MKRVRAVLFLFLVSSISLLGQSLSSLIPLNEHAIEGRLQNGLKYIIHKNEFPKGKVELRMVFNVGSVLEEENEKGMSHFLEHMVFNGSKKYPGNTVVRLLQRMGIRYGYDLNAFTDNDKTIYILPVPVDEPKNMDVALDIFYDWLTALSLSSNDIEKEKKVVMQEIRDAEIPDIFYHTKIGNSRYAERPVLGDEKDIERIDSLALRSYYDKWYRPDLLTIIAVGNLNPIEIENKIKSIFSSVDSRIAKAPKRTLYSLPIKGENALQQEQDTLISTNKLDIIFPETVKPQTSYQDLKNSLVDQLYRYMLSGRISKDKLIKCYYSRSWYLSNIYHQVFELSAENDSILYSSVEHLGYLLAQIKQHGFIEAELDKAKKHVLEYSNKENFVRTSESYCNDYIDLAITEDRYIDNKTKYDFFSKVIDNITLDDFVSMTDNFLNTHHRKLFCYLFNSHKSSSLENNFLLNAWDKGITASTSKYPIDDVFIDNSMVESNNRELEIEELPDSYILNEIKYQSIGLTEFKLSNGLRVALRPTLASDNKNIFISLFSRGGFSVLPPEKYPYFNSTAAYVDMCSVDTLSVEGLSDFCYRKELALSTNIDNYYHEIYGAAFDGNIDDLLKLLYLKITKLKENRDDFENDIQVQIIDIGKENILQKQINRSSDRVLQHQIADYSGAIHKNNERLSTKEDILKIDLTSNIRFYEQLFRNSNQLTAVITGNFDIDSIKPKIVKYLGALPNQGTLLKMADIGNHFPSEVRREIIEDNEISRANITNLIHGKYKHSLKETLILKIMRDIINNRLLESIREKEGLVYSPFVDVAYRAYLYSEFYFNINYYCDEETILLLENLLWKILNNLKKEYVSNDELDSIKQAFLISKRETLSNENTAEWRTKLKEMYLENSTISDFVDYDNILSGISIEDIKRGFEEYINPNSVMTISMINNKANSK